MTADAEISRFFTPNWNNQQKKRHKAERFHFSSSSLNRKLMGMNGSQEDDSALSSLLSELDEQSKNSITDAGDYVCWMVQTGEKCIIKVFDS